ncbi:Clp protease N-terminal domain-containing protein [Microbacterium sp.]|uniref:Clp protease N-terminal domain-containing protein n=1 Tax=Microbacterium sp. TaxID=51671 RepID=UPI0039E6630D
MSKFVRAAQTSQSLSLVAMEEASRLGVREADIEHLLLALVLNDQNAGRALRSLGVDIEAARQAVAEQHDTHLASLGIDAEFPAPGRIVFHETDGYQWRKRASDLLARSAGKGRDGDAGAVLRELLIEPSGLIVDILERLGVTPQRVREELDRRPSRRVSGGRRSARGGRPGEGVGVDGDVRAGAGRRGVGVPHRCHPRSGVGGECGVDR